MRSLAIILSFLVCGSTFAEKPKDAAKMDPKAEKAMQEWKKYSTPVTEHKLFKDLEGKWTYTMKGWMDAGSPPEESTGTSTNTTVMNGRFMKTDVTGNVHGEAFQGTGLMGYNNMTKEYESTWIDSMSTGMMKGTGTPLAGGKTIKETGSFSCPVTGEKQRAYRAETIMKDKNNYTYAMYTKGPDGKEFKMMEITYKRAM